MDVVNLSPSESNHFALFGLPVRFALDIEQLEQAFRTVQQQVHPDRFSQASDAEQRLAMQWAANANDAYHTLKSPVRRAMYVCRLQGVDVQAEKNTAMPPDFLMQQMEWREQLQAARATQDMAALDALQRAYTQTQQQWLVAMTVALDQQQNYTVAAALTRQALFIEKFAQEIDHVFDQLDASPH